MEAREAVVGFLIALSVATTGVGGGSFATPALVLFFGLPAAQAVGTALVFSFILRIAIAPLYAFGKRVHFRFLGLMLSGAVPGLLLGIWLLRAVNTKEWNPVIEIVIGSLLVFTALFSLFRSRLRSAAALGRAAWLPWVGLPIGFETGISAAGAGAMGTMVLLHCPEITSSEAVGTDLSFGLVLAALGAGFHFSAGTVSSSALRGLLLGGIPGLLLGCYFSRRVSSRNLRPVILVASALLGAQLLWAGTREIARRHEKATVAMNPVRRVTGSSYGASEKLKILFDGIVFSGVSFSSIQVQQFSANPLLANMAMCTCCCICPGERPGLRTIS
ncbi:MAG TPA: sulfite exporter TauE/SafE family protein [Terriglobales bacterium]|nr:sulfite exporter TauE/SafE family protein [Terriglobales bacterium]